MVKAWQAIYATDAEFEGQTITGSHSDLDSIPPYWLCLDEMNLAPVEQYFADYLSILETREWHHNEDSFVYRCDPLLKANVFKEVDQDKLRTSLGLDGDQHNDLWYYFCNFGISLPFNLMVAGTVNMDETTHGFSRKVIDRALSFDFGEFFPNDFDQFFNPQTKNKILTYPIWSDGRNPGALAQTKDVDGTLSIAFLQAINTVLDDTPFKLAYRALNELLLSVIAAKPQTNEELMAVWDDFVMCKVLPRIEGDSDKLAIYKESSFSDGNSEQNNLLQELSNVLKDQLSDIWTQQRPDLYRENTTETDKTIFVNCRSKKKLHWMQQRLKQATFTSFWP